MGSGPAFRDLIGPRLSARRRCDSAPEGTGPSHHPQIRVPHADLITIPPTLRRSAAFHQGEGGKRPDDAGAWPTGLAGLPREMRDFLPTAKSPAPSHDAEGRKGPGVPGLPRSQAARFSPQ